MPRQHSFPQLRKAPRSEKTLHVVHLDLMSSCETSTSGPGGRSLEDCVVRFQACAIVALMQRNLHSTLLKAHLRGPAGASEAFPHVHRSRCRDFRGHANLPSLESRFPNLTKHSYLEDHPRNHLPNLCLDIALQTHSLHRSANEAAREPEVRHSTSTGLGCRGSRHARQWAKGRVGEDVCALIEYRQRRCDLEDDGE